MTFGVSKTTDLPIQEIKKDVQHTRLKGFPVHNIVLFFPTIPSYSSIMYYERILKRS